jgi:hypothetical protein
LKALTIAYLFHLVNGHPAITRQFQTFVAMIYASGEQPFALVESLLTMQLQPLAMIRRAH